jgi:hypothetical protein
MADSVGDSRLKHHALGLEAGQIHAYELACLQHRSSTEILRLAEAKCKPILIG